MSKTKINEDISHDFGDVNGDGYTDLIVVSGGNEFKSGKAIQPRLYINNKGIFSQDVSQFTGIELNASKVKLIDFDNDQDLDICILADAEKTIFGQTPRQYLLENDGKGNFQDVTETIAPEFQYVGNAKDFLFIDINNDNQKDLIVVGHWMPITVFLNTNDKLVKSDFNGFDKTNGW